MYNMVTLVDSTVLYNWNVMIEWNLNVVNNSNKNSMGGDGYVINSVGESFHYAYVYQISTLYTLHILQFLSVIPQ